MIVEAWKEWDEHSAWEQPAKRMESECQRLAAEYGVVITDLRIMLAEFRRRGMTVEQAVEQLRKVLALDECSL